VSAAADLIEQAYFWTGEFTFETIRNDGILSESEIASWESTTSEFYAELYQDLDLDDPILGCGVLAQVTNQTSYLVSTSDDNGNKKYGVVLDVEVVVTYHSASPSHNVGILAMEIFARDEQDNDLRIANYLSNLRSLSDSLNQVRRMSLDVSSAQAMTTQNPIPTISLPKPTSPPTTKPTTMNPTKTPFTSEPTKAPTKETTPSPTISNNAPTTDETRPPTAEPKPTPTPTRGPTRTPTVPVYTYYATTELIFKDTIGPLDASTYLRWRSLTEEYLTGYVEGVLKTNSLQELDVEVTAQDYGRRLTRRRLQDDGDTDPLYPLYVEFNAILEVTSNTFNAQSLIDGAFATKGRRQDYLTIVKTSDDEFFNTIETVSLPEEQNSSDINDDGNNDPININKAPTTVGSAISSGAKIGIAIGAIFLVLALIGLIYQSKQSSSGSMQKQKDTTGVLTGENSTPKNLRPDAEIIVHKDTDDVSTLGDPFFGNAAMEDRTVADKTVSNSSVQNSYDFFKLLGKNSLLGDKVTVDREEETNTKTPGMEIAEDDASFEELFGEMK
jgi:hypothetical protein